MRLLTLARDLQRRKARERLGLFVAEGVRTTEELLRSPLAVRGALVAPTLSHTPRGAALRAKFEERKIPVQDVSEHEFESAASTDTPQGVLAVGEVPAASLPSLELPPRPRLLVLDAIQDPGNVGTLLRTAAAFDVTATLAMPGTVDLWNGKVVRSAMGALFHRPALSCTWEALDEFLRAKDIPLWGADASGDPLADLSPPRALALVVGNEASGLGDAALERSARRVAIPISPVVESLNVAVAAGILLYHLRP
jgi:TrmH family RNA methyltransferase